VEHLRREGGATITNDVAGSAFATRILVVVLVVPFILEVLHELLRPLVAACGFVVVEGVHRLAQGPVRQALARLGA